MPVRRTRNNRSLGYGAFGTLLPVQGGAATFNFRQEAGLIPLPPATSSTQPEDFVTWVVTINWRFKIKVVSELPGIRKRYRVNQGFEQFGQYKTLAGSYVTDHGNISFSDVMSAVYSCTYVFGQGSSDESIPCDEPPSDTPFVLLEEANWVAYSAYVLTGTRFFGPLSPHTAGIPADSAQFYFDTSVLSAIVGGTYVYGVDGYTAGEITGTQAPVRILY